MVAAVSAYLSVRSLTLLARSRSSFRAARHEILRLVVCIYVVAVVVVVVVVVVAVAVAVAVAVVVLSASPRSSTSAAGGPGTRRRPLNESYVLY